MKLFSKIKHENGLREFCLLGKKIFSYQKPQTEFDLRYARRFEPTLTLDEKIWLIREQFKRVGYPLNLAQPQTFNEKMQWLKLFNPDPLITICAGKDTAKNYVAEQIGAEYVVPTLAIYDTAEEIDFTALPNELVLKVNWGTGQNLIVRDKTKLNLNAARQQLTAWLNPRCNNYYHSFEWSYKDIVPKIIAEKYIGELADNLTCYKVFNFGGKPYLIQAVFDDKTRAETINYYDLNWNLLDLRQCFPNHPRPVPRPPHLAKMLALAEKLAAPFKTFVRTDFYLTAHGVLFSEFTFFSDNGMATFYPSEWDKKLGALIKLPNEEAMV